MLRKRNQIASRSATVRKSNLRSVPLYGWPMPIRSWEVDQARLRDPARLLAVRRTRLLDTPAEPALDRFTREASSRLAAPISLVTLVDEHRQFFASMHGRTAPHETPMSESVCKYAVIHREPVVIDDLCDHAELQEAVDKGVRAYCGAPLTTAEGHVLGALCVLDSKPRSWTPGQVEALTTMAAEVVEMIEAP